jgi:hypothetical protein
MLSLSKHEDQAVFPASTVITVPVMFLAASDIR